MKIYIEQVLLTNFIIDFCILLVISRLVFAKISYKRIILSSIFGSIATLIYPYCINIILANLLKIITAIIMLQILHPTNKKQLILSYILMLGLSYTIGGAILSNFGTQTANGYTLKGTSMWIVFAVTIISTFVVCKIIKWLKTKITTNTNIHEITLVYDDNKVIIKSFIDSGNGLCDNNEPVSLINFDTFSRLTNLTLNQYLTQQFGTLKDAHFINASTIAGKRKILVFTINTLTFNGKSKTYNHVKLGVALNFDNTKEYKAILNSSFCFS